MTTQAIKTQISTPQLTVNFLVTGTDDQWNELVDETNSKSLGEVMAGRTINQLSGSYTAGGGMIRIRNIDSREIVEFLPLPKVGTEKMIKLEQEHVIDSNDVLEVFCVAVPT